jgi:FixJ family two-component response regulator
LDRLWSGRKEAKLERRLVIAVVDDEENVCKALRRLLRASGFDCEIFPSGQGFLQALGSHRPAVVLLDWLMPGVTGAEALRRAKSSHSALPVIVISGRDEPGEAETCLALGAAAFLLKPVDDEELLGTVARAIEAQ